MNFCMYKQTKAQADVLCAYYFVDNKFKTRSIISTKKRVASMGGKGLKPDYSDFEIIFHSFLLPFS